MPGASALRGSKGSEAQAACDKDRVVEEEDALGWAGGKRSGG